MNGIDFIDDHEHILYDRDLDIIKSYLAKGEEPPRFEAAGPREKIFLTQQILLAGFIAAYSVLVDNQVNFCLIPEVPFSLDVFLEELKKRLEQRVML